MNRITALAIGLLTIAAVASVAIGQQRSVTTDYREQAANGQPHLFLIAADNLSRQGDEAGALANIEKAKKQHLSALDLQAFLESAEPLEGDTTTCQQGLVLSHFPELIEFVMNGHIDKLNNGSLENNDTTKGELTTLYCLAEEFAPDMAKLIADHFDDYLIFTEFMIVDDAELEATFPNYNVEDRFNDDSVVPYPEKKASFPEGDAAMYSFIKSYITYPDELKDAGVYGKVVVSFIVDADGYLSDLEVLRGKHPMLDAEARRIVSIMPLWIPAEHEGKKVASKVIIPISFQLPENTSSNDNQFKTDKYITP